MNECANAVFIVSVYVFCCFCNLRLTLCPNWPLTGPCCCPSNHNKQFHLRKQNSTTWSWLQLACFAAASTAIATDMALFHIAGCCCCCCCMFSFSFILLFLVVVGNLLLFSFFAAAFMKLCQLVSYFLAGFLQLPASIKRHSTTVHWSLGTRSHTKTLTLSEMHILTPFWAWNSFFFYFANGQAIYELLCYEPRLNGSCYCWCIVAVVIKKCVRRALLAALPPQTMISKLFALASIYWHGGQHFQYWDL